MEDKGERDREGEERTGTTFCILIRCPLLILG